VVGLKLLVGRVDDVVGFSAVKEPTTEELFNKELEPGKATGSLGVLVVVVGIVEDVMVVVKGISVTLLDSVDKLTDTVTLCG
jgi:hypothetical protein